MNTLPPAFVERIKKQLGAEAEAFFQALETPAPVSIRRNPGKATACNELEITEGKTTPVPWCPDAVYLEGRPVFTLDPLFHGGAYYVQEASSMFLHHVLKQLLPPTPVRMLDLCAAPGGKSTLAASLLPPGSLLVSNEVIRSRAAILKENLIKWGQDNTVVTQSDPAAFRALEGAFDFLLVDAPCSGEGMFRKDPASIREWSENNLRLCSERQQRILADSWACLRLGGVLIYSTCTYNPAENERIIEWLIAGGEAESIPLSCPFPGIMPADSTACAFRFYPHKTAGEGFFLAALRKTAGKDYTPRKNKKAKNAPRTALPKELRAYIRQPEQYDVFPDNGILRLVPESQAAFIETLSGYARKGAAAEFARHCEDPRARKTASSWYAMRKFSSSETHLTGIHSYEAKPERCRLHLENARGEIGTAICRRANDGSWKFLSFTFVTPEENQ